ncbi:GerAB/ArcD/ProY family transporter [Aquibacillus kalidii]|uniref:GerAB/ArcD/ProY family transporter n=1 Tax=Aquibacillus kalidii TaxID=2762597 RepID=UPI001645C3C4|nr:endospore germination permease [Aquibacillus kalidii]
MKDHKTLKTRELFAMMTIFVGMKLADTTPSLLSSKASNAFWMIPIISFIVIIPSFLLLIFLLKKYKDKNLIQLLEAILGTYLGKALGFTIFLSAFLSLSLDSRNYVEQIKLLYFPESPTTILYFVFIGVAFIGAKKGLEVIGYSSWIGLPLIKFSMLLMAFLIFDRIILLRIFPIFGDGLDVVLTQGIKKASIFSELFLFTIAYTAFKDTNTFRKGSYLGSFVVIFEITFFFLLYTLVFDYNSVGKVAFPFHDITQYINFGDYFTNVETFFMVFWLLAAYMRFIIFLYLIAWIFAAVFNIKEFEPLILPFAFFTIIIGMIPDNTLLNDLFYRDRLLNYMTPLFISFPIILWIVAFFKGDLKKT